MFPPHDFAKHALKGDLICRCSIPRRTVCACEFSSEPTGKSSFQANRAKDQRPGGHAAPGLTNGSIFSGVSNAARPGSLGRGGIPWNLETAFRCRSCGTPRYRPPVHMIRLSKERKIAPCVWVHPDDDDRR